MLEREMSNTMDRLKLIAEIRNRPQLWNMLSKENSSRISIQDLWREVATSMGPDVTIEECKRIWKNLRDAYRAEVKRIELRIERDLLKGSYDPNNEYGSKWTYFEPMQFVKHFKRRRRSRTYKAIDSPTHQAVNEVNIDNDDSDQFSQFHNMDNIKMEPDVEMDTEVFSLDDDDDDDDDEGGNYNQLYSEHLLKQAAQQNSSQKQPEAKPSTTPFKCSKRSYEQVHFLEDLEKEEQNLMKSTRLDISHSNDLAHVGDSDYNFLVSFLPQMKKMTELQNLQFRAKMTNLMLEIMSPTMSAATAAPVSSSSSSSHCANVNSNNYLVILLSYHRAHEMTACKNTWKHLRACYRVKVKIVLYVVYVRIKLTVHTTPLREITAIRGMLSMRCTYSKQPESEAPSCPSDNENTQFIDDDNIKIEEESDNEIDMDDEEFLSMPIKQNNSLSKGASNQFLDDLDYNFLISFSAQMKLMTPIQNLQFRGQMTDLILNILKIGHSSNDSKALENIVQLKGFVDISDLDLMDKFRLIAEVHKRPILWDLQLTERPLHEICDNWKEIAKSLGDDVTAEDCKSVWKSLRDAYRVVKYRKRNRMKRDQRSGKYDPKKDYSSKWVYCEPMKFLDGHSKCSRDSDSDQSSNLAITENNKHSIIKNQSELRRDRRKRNSSINDDNISCNSSLSKTVPNEIDLLDDSDEEDLLKRLKSCEEYNENDESKVSYTKQNRNEIKRKSPRRQSRLNKSLTPEQKTSNVTNENPLKQKCLNESEYIPSYSSKPQSSYYQINFLDETDEEEPIIRSQHNQFANADIKEEPALDIETVSHPFLENEIQSPKLQSLNESSTLQQNEVHSIQPQSLAKNSTLQQNRNIKDKNKRITLRKEINASQDFRLTAQQDIGDPDCNFLISFLSHMKSLTALQNLQFRVQMSDLILSFLTNSSSANEFKTPECNAKIALDIRDPDCNFLMSFWPYMKLLTPLQNLEYRAKVSHLMINIYSKDEISKDI
ncbi:hypothetical protein CVS40_3854 [Lucilia cuprina]|nr:hypothetical protein CVS40_3854 [Lucilia cuprina]